MSVFNGVDYTTSMVYSVTSSYIVATEAVGVPTPGTLGSPPIYVMRGTQSTDGRDVYWYSFYPDPNVTAFPHTASFSNVVVSNVGYWQQWTAK